MAKTLDFNSVQRPVLAVTMKDDERTVLHVTAPKEALIEELQTVAGELEAVVKGSDRSAIGLVFDLAARILSCNRDYIKVTADELQHKYDMDLEELILFFNVYLDFIREITASKN